MRAGPLGETPDEPERVEPELLLLRDDAIDTPVVGRSVEAADHFGASDLQKPTSQSREEPTSRVISVEPFYPIR
jgi:hypothetical protein